MGFMGSIPIAGVIWQHIHYIVGLQRLGHDVYYVEDSARLPYNPETFEVNEELDYAAKILNQLSRDFDFKNRWAFCARYLKGNPTAGLPLKKIRQLYREADAVLNICGTQEFNDDLLANERILYVESDPGVEQIKIDKRVRSTIDYLRRHHALFTFGENVGTKKFPGANTRIQMAADAATGRDRSLENKSLPSPRRGFHFGGELVDQRIERHYLARRKISLEQIARVHSLHLGTKKMRRNVRACDGHQRSRNPNEISTQRLAFYVTAATERRLLALPRLRPPLERRIHRGERSIRPLKHRLVQRPQRLLSGGRPASDHSGHWLHGILRKQWRPVCFPLAQRNCRCRESDQP